MNAFFPLQTKQVKRKYALFITTIMLCCNLHNSRGCGVVGYVGPVACKKIILEGLSRLEYRGYDSSGFCCIDPLQNKFTIIKSEGKLDNLRQKSNDVLQDGYTGMGHTRWATHGSASDSNAHPHTDCHNSIAVVHNGIIENCESHKKALQKAGHHFRSDTDTEIIAHLFRICLDKQTSPDITVRLKQATQELVGQLDGSFALIIMIKDCPSTSIAVRCNSPLTIGMGNGEKFIASDVIAYAEKTNDILFLPNKSYAIVTPDMVDLCDFDGNTLGLTIKRVNIAPMAYEKNNHEHYMLKEIYEQPDIIQRLGREYQLLGDRIFEQFGLTQHEARELQSIHLLGCGSSWHAGLIGAFFFEHIAKIPTQVHLASEFRYKPIFKQENTLYIAISQSGETADTLESIRLAQSNGLPVATVTNMPSSSMVRETRGYIETKAGPEISVASTKAFTTQVIALYWLAHLIAKEKGIITAQELQNVVHQIDHAASVLQQSLEIYQGELRSLAKICTHAPLIMCLGRHSSYPLALEGALKLKEITYIPTQGTAAGELKHGTLALIDASTPVIVLSHLDPILYKKTVANAQEVKARQGMVIAVTFEGQNELSSLADFVLELPRTEPLLAPIAMSGILQFLAYEIARQLGHDIDMPRNLAKSVTVE